MMRQSKDSILWKERAINNRFKKDPYFAPKEEKGGLLKETKKC